MDWYRCSLTLNRTAGGSNNLIFYVSNVYGNKPAYVGDEVTVYTTSKISK